MFRHSILHISVGKDEFEVELWNKTLIFFTRAGCDIQCEYIFFSSLKITKFKNQQVKNNGKF